MFDSVARRKRFTLMIALILFSLIPATLHAQAYDAKDFRNWLDALRPIARAAGVSDATFDHVLGRITPDCGQTGVFCGPPPSEPAEPAWTERTNLPKSCDKTPQREFLEPAAYFPESHIGRLVRKGQTLLGDMRVNRPDTFQHILKVEQTYGVPVPILMGLWARETSFGDASLPHNTVIALVSLAYAGHEHRRPWMRRQLIAALRMLDEGHIAFENFRSSWAGATGLTQVMPEEYLQFGADGDGDGVSDIWTSAPDALATTANILRHRGWRARQGWGREVRLPDGADGWDCTWEGRTNRMPVRRWTDQFGVALADRGAESTAALLTGDETVYPLTPAGAYGPAYLAGENFDVLRAYNPSDLYALFIGYVADRLACDTQAGPCIFTRPWPASANPFAFSVENVCRLQLGLKAKGMLTGEADGLFGPQTRAAIGRWQKAQGGRPTCYPSRELFDQLTGDWKPEAMHKHGAPVTPSDESGHGAGVILPGDDTGEATAPTDPSTREPRDQRG